MQRPTARHKGLKELNTVLLKERAAIINLKMDRLYRIQKDKSRLLRQIRENADKPDIRELTLIRTIQDNVHHNRYLLKSGLQLIGRMQREALNRSAMTYSNKAVASVSDSRPRILLQRA